MLASTQLRCLALACLYVLLAGFGESLQGQSKLYPVKAGVIDLTKPPYNADPTGVLDAAPAINQAFLDHNDEHEILYLPAGTYRLSGKVQWGDNGMCTFPGNSTCQRRTVLAGAGTDQTLLKLDDNHPDFQTTTNPRGEELITTGSSAAMHFDNSIRHLTISTGTGNPAATALTFMANNNGGVYDVDIRTEDGQGVIGLNMFANEQNGPLLVQDVEVDGFDIGVNTFGNQNSLTFERITVRNQNVYGIFNKQQISTFRQLTSINAVTAAYNQGDGGSTLTIIDSDLQGTGAASSEIAVINVNRRQLFVRNTTTSGYAHAIQEFSNGFSLGLVANGYVEEYVSGEVARACDNVERSLNLPIVEAPAITYAPTNTWVSIEDFGASIDNGFQGQGSAQDDTPAIQAALNSGAATIVIPSPGAQFPQRYIAFGDLVIPPSVKHIIGGRGFINGTWGFVSTAGTDRLVIEDIVSIPYFRHESARELQLRSGGLKLYESLPAGGSGDVFIEDINGGPFYFHQQDVYARQLNPENDSLNILNDGGTLWILGIKIEKKGTMVKTINGGKTEIIGAFAYATIAEEATPKPLFEVVNSSLSVAGLKEITYINDAYDVKLRETRGGVTREIAADAPADVIQKSLLVAYPSTAANVAPSVSAGDDQVLVPPSKTTTLTGAVNDDGLPSGVCFTQRTWTMVSGPDAPAFNDATDPTTEVTFPEAGVYVLRLTADDGSTSTTDEVTVYVSDAFASTLDHDGDGTPSGNGADAELRGFGSFQNNYGGSQQLIARNFTSFPRKSILRIDRAANPGSVANAVLEFDISTTNTGLIEAWTYNVFGLNDGNAGEDWTEGDGTGRLATGTEVTYDNAPGNVDNTPYGGAYDPNVTNSGGVLTAETTFLGTFTLRANRREKVSMSTPELAAFLNADTDDNLSFLITRVESTSNSIGFASKENTSFAAPRLYFDFVTAPVPVEVVSLSAKPSGQDVGVAWHVGEEIDLAGYRVEHSRDGQVFAKAGNVDASGLRAYSFTHLAPGAGRHYYRLVSIDGDGTEVKSTVVTLRLESSRINTYTLSPNPLGANGLLSIRQLGEEPVGDLAVEVFDALGRSVLRQRFPGLEAVRVLDMRGLAAGSYAVVLQDERGVQRGLVVR